MSGEMALVLERIWPLRNAPEIFVQGRVLVRSGWSYGVGLACGRFSLGHLSPRVPCVDRRRLLGRGIAFSPSSISESRTTTWKDPHSCARRRFEAGRQQQAAAGTMVEMAPNHVKWYIGYLFVPSTQSAESQPSPLIFGRREPSLTAAGRQGRSLSLSEVY